VPVVGYLYSGAPEPNANFTAAFRKGLSEAGYVEGRNVAIEYRFANRNRTVAGIGGRSGPPPGGRHRHTSLASEVIVTNQTAAARAAQQRTKTIPIVFTTAGDPVVTGLVQNIAGPRATSRFGTSASRQVVDGIGWIAEHSD
jgi:putative ABC transport system substrate-binding protein